MRLINCVKENVPQIHGVPKLISDIYRSYQSIITFLFPLKINKQRRNTRAPEVELKKSKMYYCTYI